MESGGIRITKDIPYGNIAAARVEVQDAQAVVRFTADPCGGPEAMWFCFRIELADGSAGRPAAIELVLEHVGNLLGGRDGANLRPVVRTDAEDWRRLPWGEPRALADGRKEAVWRVETPARWLEVAMCYPYGAPEVDQLVRDIGWTRDTIGVSQNARPITRLSNHPGEEGGDRPGLYLIARQHSGETSASWVLDGLLRTIASWPSTAQPLVWVVPLSNIDGVEEGAYGKDNYPYDLNRAWGRPAYRHETLVIQHDLDRWVKRCRPVLAFDFHAPGAAEDTGIYLYVPDEETMPDARAAADPWSEALGKGLADWAADDFARVARYASRWQTPNFTRAAADRLNVAAVSLEVPYAAKGEEVFTRERYREAGARLAGAIGQVLAGDKE